MKAGVVGPSYMQRSLPFDAQRTINLFPIMDDMGKEPASLLGTPGRVLFTDLANGEGRGIYKATNGRCFAVSGDGLFEIMPDKTHVRRGDMLLSSGTVQFADNGFQLAVCDGRNLFILVFESNEFSQVRGGATYIENGKFETDTVWTKGSGWTIEPNDYAYGDNTSEAISQTTVSALIEGNRYVVSYKIGQVSYVSNGLFDGPDDWILGDGWSISGGAARRTSSGSTALTQTSPSTLVSGKKYIVSFNVNRTGGSIRVSLGGGTQGAAISSSQYVTQIITAGATQEVRFDASNFVGSISNVTIRDEVTGSLVVSVGGNDGQTRTTPGSYRETITAGSTQVIAFTGDSFTGSLSDVTVEDVSSGFKSASSLTFIDGYFVISESPDSGVFRVSGLYDGFVWDSLQFATAESSPDNLLKVTNVNGQLWLSGTETTEIWANVGNLGFPFQRVSGAKIEHGILGKDAGVSLDSSLFWVGRSPFGKGIVYRADGFSPQRISTETIERILSDLSLEDQIRVYAYQEDGHTFLCVSGGDMKSTFCYDLLTNMWHERVFMNNKGDFEQDKAHSMAFAFGVHLSIDYRNGRIYQQSLDFLDDDGDEIVRERTFTHMFDQNTRIVYNNLTVGFEAGVGTQTGQGSDPKAVLYISNDGAKTWTGGVPKSIGKVGEFLTRVVWHRLGQARQRTFKIRITDPVKVAITGGWFNVQ